MTWNSEQVLDQIELGEDSHVEFKEVTFAGNRVREPRREVIADELAVFGNATGGTLIFSVSDTGIVQPLNRQRMDALEEFVSEICADSIKPGLPFETQRLKLPDGSSVLIVEVEQGAVVHLRDDDTGKPRITIAGALLCTERPEAHMRGAVTEAVRYHGTVQGHAGQHDSKTINGPLDRQTTDAVNFVRLNSRVSARKEPGRVEMPQFSLQAVFETVVNAVVHREYAIKNAKIRLFIFDDRLELHSPGALPNTLSIEAMPARQVTRNETPASALHWLEIGDVPGSGDRQYFLEERGEGVPIMYEEAHDLTGQYPRFELLDNAELRLTLPSSRPPTVGIEGEVSVSANGQLLARVQVVALYPNKTWMELTTDASGRAVFGFHSELPITAFCAAPGYRGCVTHDWRPPQPLAVALKLLPSGGSTIFTEQTGHVPGLTGRLNPILDDLDRMYLHASSVTIDEGKPQPVHFKLKQPLQLTDVNGFERIVRFIDMIGKSALLEYEPAESAPHREDTK